MLMPAPQHSENTTETQPSRALSTSKNIKEAPRTAENGEPLTSGTMHVLRLMMAFIVLCDGLGTPFAARTNTLVTATHRASHVQLMATKSGGGGKAQNRKATNLEAVVAKKKKGGKAKKRKASKASKREVAVVAHARRREMALTAQVSQLDTMLYQATSVASMLASSANATVAEETLAQVATPEGSTSWAESGHAELLSRLLHLGSNAAESDAEASSLQEALDAKSTEVSALSELVSALQERAKRAELTALKLQEMLEEEVSSRAADKAHAASTLQEAIEATERAEAEAADAQQYAKAAEQVSALQARASSAELAAIDLQAKLGAEVGSRAAESANAATTLRRALEAAERAEAEAVAARRAAEAEASAASAARAVSLRLFQQQQQAQAAQAPAQPQQVPVPAAALQAPAQALPPPVYPVLEDFMLNQSNTAIHASIREWHASFPPAVGPAWARINPTTYELAVRNDAEEIYIVFKLLLVPPSRPWEDTTKRLIVTHVGVPVEFRRRGILSRTMDELVDVLEPDEIEIDRILSDKMRSYATSRGYTLVPGHKADGGSFRRERLPATVETKVAQMA